jgi:two-component system, NarL family, response regulator DevR
MTGAQPIRILLVDDSEVVRVGLAAVLGQEPDLEVIGQAGTSTDAVIQAQRLRPDLVLMDVRIPEVGGIEAGREILEQQPGIRVLFLSAFNDEELVRAAIVIGAHGYLLKEIDAQTLIDSIKRVALGESILDPALRSGMVDWVLRNVPAPEVPERPALTPQEQRIIALVAEGKTNKEIAAQMELSPKTVKNYLHNVFEKLGIKRRSQAAALHIRKELGR